MEDKRVYTGRFFVYDDTLLCYYGLNANREDVPQSRYSY